MDLKKLIKEVLEGKDCCTATKPTKAPILNESLAPRDILSEGLKYHIDNKKPLTEHVYRAGSSNYFNLWAEARTLYSRGILDFSGDDLEILTETNLGEFGIIYEIEIGDQVKASKEYGGLSGEVVDIRGSFIVVKTKEGNQSYHESDLKVLNKEGKKVPLDFIMLEEGNKSLDSETIKQIKSDISSFPKYQKRGFESFKKEVRQRYKITPQQLEDILSGDLNENEDRKFLIQNAKEKYNKLQQAFLNSDNPSPKLEKQLEKAQQEYEDLIQNKITEFGPLAGSGNIDYFEKITDEASKRSEKGITIYVVGTKKGGYKLSKYYEDGNTYAGYYNGHPILDEYITESKENKPIGKPKRGGAKKFYVYVRNPKTKKIKKVSFGDTSGLSAKINNPKARQAFAKRHDCKNKKDRTKASYWSCRLPSYAKLLGLKSNFSGFW